MIVDHTSGQERIIDILPSRRQKVLRAWLRGRKRSGQLDALIEVSCDLWEPYRQAVRKELGLEPTADRFHVHQLFSRRIDQVRREIQRSLPKDKRAGLKGLRWLLLKSSASLGPKEMERLDRARRDFPEIRMLVENRDRLSAIFDDPENDSPEKGQAALQAWIDSVSKLQSKALAKFSKTLTNWMEPICRYFLARTNNGRTEGYNRGIRMIVSRAFGLPGFAHLRLRVLGVFG